MIRKYLICGKRNLFLQSKISEKHGEIGRVIELLLPVHDYWALEDGIKDVNYLIASSEAPVEIARTYKKVLSISSRFAVKEQDRLWLYATKKDSSS
jgi:hypothetical protein